MIQITTGTQLFILNIAILRRTFSFKYWNKYLGAQSPDYSIYNLPKVTITKTSKQNRNFHRAFLNKPKSYFSIENIHIEIVLWTKKQPNRSTCIQKYTMYECIVILYITFNYLKSLNEFLFSFFYRDFSSFHFAWTKVSLNFVTSLSSLDHLLCNNSLLSFNYSILLHK